MNKRVLVNITCLVLLIFINYSCKRSPNNILETNSSNNSANSPINTTVDPSETLNPETITGEKAENDPASIVVKEYFSAIQAGQYEKAYSLLTGNFKKSKGSFADFVAPLSQAAAKGRRYGDLTIQGVNSSVSGLEKIVTFTMIITENQQMMNLSAVYFVMQGEDSSWKIADVLRE